MNDTNTEEEILILWEAPKIVPPEFRLYYDETNGKVICYTCEKLEGKYIVIDSITYAQARPDVRVLNGKLTVANEYFIVSKLMPDSSEGKKCAAEDISIIAVNNENTIKWKLNTYELK